MTTTTVGVPTGGKPINLSQLQAEMTTAGVDVSMGLGETGSYVHTYQTAPPLDSGLPTAAPSDFESASRATVEQVIADHVAMRNKTTEEYAAEFQNPETPPARKQEIRDIQNGLLPPEQVPMETPP